MCPAAGVRTFARVLYLLHATLAAVTFGLALNAFLRRPGRQAWDVLLGLAWLALLAATALLLGRSAALVAAGTSLFYLAIWIPLAGPLARSLFGVRPDEEEFAALEEAEETVETEPGDVPYE